MNIPSEDYKEEDFFKKIRLILRPESSFYFISVIYGIGVGLLTLAVPISVQSLVNTVTFGVLTQPLVVLSILLLSLLTFSGVLRTLQTYMVEVFQRHFYARTTADIAVKLINADYQTIRKKNTVELVNRYFDVMTVQKSVATLITDGFSILLQTITGFILLAFYHPYFIVFDFLLIFLIWLAWFLFGKKALKSAVSESKAKYKMASWLEEIARVNLLFKSIDNKSFALKEEKSRTLDSGELRMGLELSLWRYRDLDNRRLEVRNSIQEIASKENKFVSTENKAKSEATKAYWEWVAKGKTLAVYQGLLQVAIERDEAIKRKVKTGDQAKIYQVENQQYILKRKGQVLRAQRDFENAILYLSLFYRDPSGVPLEAKEDLLPDETGEGDFKFKPHLQQDFKRAQSLNPSLRNIDIEINKVTNLEYLAENKLLPKADLSIEVARDNGRGASHLKGVENRFLLKIEVPIERNLGKGKIAQLRSQKMAYQYQSKLFQEQIETKLRTIYNRLKTAQELVENTRQEVELAKIMQRAELVKFENGASDYFVVNMREQSTADAKAKHIKAFLDYQKSLAEYKELTLNF